MKFTEFKKSLDQKNEYSVYIFEGEDAYFRLRGLNTLKSNFITEPSINYVSFGEGDFAIKDLLASLDSYPFMSPKRMTMVSEFYPDKSTLNALKSYLENPTADSMLVILNQKKTETLKKFSSVAVVDCGKQDTALLVRWVKAECKNNGVTVTDDGAQRLVEFCLNDMSRIENETHKLIAYVGTNGCITEDTVKENVSEDTEYKVYELTDYIGKRKYDQALKVVSDLLSKGETPQRLIISIYSYFRRLLHLSISDKSIQELSSMMGVKEFAVKKMIEQSKNFKKRSIKRAVDFLTDADYKIKTGAIDQTEAMWLSLFQIMNEK